LDTLKVKRKELKGGGKLPREKVALLSGTSLKAFIKVVEEIENSRVREFASRMRN